MGELFAFPGADARGGTLEAIRPEGCEIVVGRLACDQLRDEPPGDRCEPTPFIACPVATTIPPRRPIAGRPSGRQGLSPAQVSSTGLLRRPRSLNARRPRRRSCSTRRVEIDRLEPGQLEGSSRGRMLGRGSGVAIVQVSWIHDGIRGSSSDCS